MASRVQQLHLSALSELTGPQACYSGLSPTDGQSRFVTLQYTHQRVGHL